jgi:hypothetical protein
MNCQGTNKNGAGCARRVSGYCWQHKDQKPVETPVETPTDSGAKPYIRVYEIGPQACYPLSGEVFYVHSDDFDQTTLKSHHRFCLMKHTSLPEHDPDAPSILTIDKVLKRDMKFYNIRVIRGYASV